MRMLVTGASRGIGRAIALRLVRDAAAREGVQPRIVACGSSHVDLLEEAIAELKDAGAEAIPAVGDIADPEVPERLVKTATDAFGGLDAVISNAGTTRAATLMDLTLEAWDYVFNVNVRAAWLLARAAHPWLKESKGSIVTISSMSGTKPHPGVGSYSVGKAGLIMLTRLLAEEWAEDGIRANCVSPGFVYTPMTAPIYDDADVKKRRLKMVPLHQIGRAYEDIAGIVSFFVGPNSGYCTGQNIVADGGLSDSILALIPGRVKQR